MEGRRRSWGGSGRNLAIGIVGFVWERALDFGDFARGRFGRCVGCFGDFLAQESDVFEQRGCPWRLWFDGGHCAFALGMMAQRRRGLGLGLGYFLRLAPGGFGGICPTGGIILIAVR